MSTDVVRPQDVLEGDLREKLKKAIISAYMATSVIGDTSGHSIKTYVQMEEKGDGLRFYYRAEILGENYPVYCDYPSSDWDLDNFGPNVGDFPGFTGINATAVWDHIRAEVDDWLDPWVYDCPDPDYFTNQINSVARIASQLNIGGNSGSGAPPGGDADLREAVKTIDNRAFGKSAAMIAFRDAYASDLWTTVNNQCGMATAAGLALTAEAAAWNETYQTLRDFITVAIHDFGTLADAPGLDTGESVLGATAAVAGLLGATVGVAFPPFGVAMGGLSAVIGAYTVMHPAVPAVNSSPLTLSGSDYHEMWTSFTDKMTDISDDLGTAENAIAEGCDLVVADTFENPESYSLTRGVRKGNQYDDFRKIRVNEIQLNTATLRTAAGAAEVIGDQQKALGEFLVGVDAVGNPSAEAGYEWRRGTLPNGAWIGMASGGASGPYNAYKNHVRALSRLLKEEAANSHYMAEALMKAALDFEQTDQLSADQQNRLRQQINHEADAQDKNPLVRGNDPSDPWYDMVGS